MTWSLTITASPRPITLRPEGRVSTGLRTVGVMRPARMPLSSVSWAVLAALVLPGQELLEDVQAYLQVIGRVLALVPAVHGAAVDALQHHDVAHLGLARAVGPVHRERGGSRTPPPAWGSG